MITNEESIGFNNANQFGLRADREFLNYVEIPVEKEISSKIKGKFLLIKYTYDKNREEEFTDFILDSLMNYALSKEERESLDIQRARKLWETAIRRYVKNTKNFKGGEMGDIILFHLMEVVEQAVQIVNKMCLKTSGKMYYHGADAIHFGSDGDLRILFFGRVENRR